jgi:hypothetical protein
MSDSFSNFDVRQLKRNSNMMLADFTFRDDAGFGPITVKKDFITDYASLGALRNILLFVFYAILVGYGDKAATIHDWLYRGNGIQRDTGGIYYPTRLECDQIFYRALRAEGVARWRALLFYAGVRVGGMSSYKRVTATA